MNKSSEAERLKETKKLLREKLLEIRKKNLRDLMAKEVLKEVRFNIKNKHAQ